jgi:hypothetical protein
MAMTENESREKLWNNNEWLKDAKGMSLDALKDYYDDCWHDFTSAKNSQYIPDWINELEDAINEISKVFLYGLSIPAK